MDEAPLTSENTFKIILSSDKNNSYSIEFNLNNYIEIKANQINNIIHKSYSNKYSFEEIRENRYFLQFDTLDEIFDEIKDRIYNNKIRLKENDNKLQLNIPLLSKKNREIIFELKPIIKTNNDRLDELTDLVMKLSTEIDDIKNENIQLRKEYKFLIVENKQLKNEINDIKDKDKKSKNQLNNNIELLKKEINYFKNENIQLTNKM